MDEQPDVINIAGEEISAIDADTSGKLATTLFVAVIALLLVLIYALAAAA